MTHRHTVLVLAGLACLALATPAMAHASLLSSDPPAGSTQPAVPFTLTATFDEELTPDGSSIVVEGPSGLQVATGTVSAEDAHSMSAALPALPAGTYSVRWTAVTADDLAVERGSYNFSVGSAATSGTPGATQPPTNGATGSSNDAFIAVGLAAIAIAGVLAFVFVRGRR